MIPVHRLLDPQVFFIHFLTVSAQHRSLSPSKCCFTLSTLSKEKPPENSASLRITGLQVRGGVINLKSGELEEEQSREFEFNVGQLILDLCEFGAEDKPSFVSSNSFQDEEIDLPFLMVNRHNKNHSSLRKDFMMSMKSELADSKLNFVSEKSQQQSRKSFNDALPSHLSLEKTLKKKLRKQLSIMEADHEDLIKKFPVRIPFYFSPYHSLNPLTQIVSYLYITSSMPQYYWMSKGTYVCLSDH